MQNSTRYALSASLVLVLVGSSVFAGVTTSVTAAPLASSVATATTPPTPDFTPSGSKPKAFIINVLGSMVGNAMPSGWRAEQLANEYRYNHSFEQIEVATGYRADATEGYLMTTDYMNNPQTQRDYELRQMELQFKGGKGGEKPLAPPITSKPKKFVKAAVGAVGGAVTGFTGYQLGAQVGGGLVQLFGINPQGEVCTGTGGWETMLSLVTGVSCDGFNADQYYELNTDISPRAAGWDVAPLFDYTWGSKSNGEQGSGFLSIDHFSTNAVFMNPPRQFFDFSVAGSVSGNCVNNGYGSGVVQVYYWSNGGPSSPEIKSFTSSTVFGAGGTYLGTPCAVTEALHSGSREMWYNEYLDHFEFVYGNQSFNWYPEGHALWTPGTDADPARTFECVVTGDDGIEYTAITEEFKESGAWSAPVCPELPEGVHPDNISVNQNTAGMGSTNVYNEPVTQDYKDWLTNYPECEFGACKLDLLKGASQTAPSCFDTPDACVSWFEDPDKASNYQCRYGMHPVSIEECYVYAGVFDPSRIAIGSPYSDPMTGEWSGGQSSPTPDRQALGQSIQDPAAARSCNGMKIDGFDPVGFVMRPVQCALEWAFVPRPVVLQYEATKMSTSLDNVAPGQLIAMLSSWDIDPSPMTGCSRTVPWSPADSFNTGTGETVVWNVCPGTPLEFLGTISRSVVAVGFALLVYLSLKRSTSATVDYR